MKPINNIKKLVPHLRYKASPELHNRVLARLAKTMEEPKKQPSATTRPNTWRIIMKSKITKLAAAAVIIIAAIIGINQFGGSVDMATIAFADITEAMEKVSWMHISSRGFEGKIKGVVELWIGYETKISAAKEANGEATFVNFKEHKRYEYDPQNNSITIHYSYEDDLPLDMSSPTLLLESMYKRLKEQGAEIITKRGEYMGEEVQIQEISLSSVGQNNISHFARLYIEPESKLLYAAKVIYTDANGNTVIDGEMTFDYSPTGPADIYDLDVPRDARIIDKLPRDDYMAIWDKYRACRENVPDKYITIITEAQTRRWSYDGMRIFYTDNKRYRHESHFLRWDMNAPQPVKLTVDSLGKSFEALLQWAKQNDDASHSVGRFRNDPPRTGSMEQKGWPSIDTKGKVIQDDYARENNLICIERLQQGIIHDEVVSQPARFLFYINPERDYMCQRQVTEWRPGAQWQEDKDWLRDVEPEKIRKGSIVDKEITEFFEAPNGYWYPKIIVRKSTSSREKDYKNVPLEVRTIETVYLQIDPEFSEGIFDPENLPR